MNGPLELIAGMVTKALRERVAVSDTCAVLSLEDYTLILGLADRIEKQARASAQ